MSKSAYTVAKRIVRQFKNEGCRDTSCRFKSPVGMASNGGCRCHNEIESAIIAAETDLRERLAEAVRLLASAARWIEEEHEYQETIAFLAKEKEEG